MTVARKILERSIERRFVEFAKARSWLAFKFFPISYRGLPDRLVLARGGVVLFIEFKRPGGEPTPLQHKCHELLRSYGFKVLVIQSIESFHSVEAIIERRQRGYSR